MTTGLGMLQAVDLLMQEAIVLGLHVLAQDQRAIDELIGRSDALRLNTADTWRAQLRDALRDMLNPSSDQYVQVLLGYPVPGGSARLPAVSIVTSSGGESVSEATIGHDLRVAPTAEQRANLAGPEQELYETEERGSVESQTVEIGSWTVQPELTLLLHAAIGWALRDQDGRLVDLGVHGLARREGGFAPSADMDPRVGFVPLHTITVDWTRRQSRRRKVPNRIRFLTPTFST